MMWHLLSANDCCWSVGLLCTCPLAKRRARPQRPIFFIGNCLFISYVQYPLFHPCTSTHIPLHPSTSTSTSTHIHPVHSPSSLITKRRRQHNAFFQMPNVSCFTFRNSMRENSEREGGKNPTKQTNKIPQEPNELPRM